MSSPILVSICGYLPYCNVLSPPPCYPLLTVFPLLTVILLTVILSSLLSLLTVIPPFCYPSSLLSPPHCYPLLTVIPSSLFTHMFNIHMYTHAHTHARTHTHTNTHVHAYQFTSLHSSPYIRFSVQNGVNWSCHHNEVRNILICLVLPW